MVNKRKVFKIFYSSETGTAKKFAKEALEFFSLSFRTQMLPLNEVDATFESLDDCDAVSSSRRPSVTERRPGCLAAT